MTRAPHLRSRLLAFGLVVLASHPVAAMGQEVQAVPTPTSLEAEAVSPSRIDLRWTPVNTGLVVEYRIYRYPSNALVAAVSASQTGYSDTGLSPWTEYGYYVTGATASGNESSPSNIATARTRDGTPPTAPGNLGGQATSQSQISLSWTAASDAESDVTRYVVYRGGNEIGTTAGLSYQDGGLTPDQQYSYQVSAVNGQGDEGARAGPVVVRTLSEPLPDPPRNLSATPASASAIDLSWSPPADAGNVDAYRVYRDGSPIATLSGTSYRDTGLQSYRLYEYRVSSLNSGGEEGSLSPAVSARTLDGSPPTAPGNPGGQALSQSQISLTWTTATDPQTGISEYVIYRGGSEIGRTAGLSYQDNGLAPDQQYSYQVSAVNGQGDEGPRAGPIQIRTLSDKPPEPPTGLAAQAVDEQTVDLTWDLHPDDDLDGYRLYRDGLFIAATEATSFRDSGLAPFTTYVYTVTAVAEDGDESSPSAGATVTTPDPTGPTVPAGVAATAVGTERVDVAWSPSSDGESGIAGYRVFRDGAEVALTVGASYQDGGLAPGTTYEYRVSAINGAELESDLSDPASATTLDGSGPTVPTGLAAVPLSTSSMALSWLPSSDDESGISYYRLFRDGEQIATPTAAEYTDTGLMAATTYEYRVSAVNGDGLESDLSPAVSGTTPEEEGPPPPTALTATPTGPSTIDLSWTAPEGGAAGYSVFRDGEFIGTVTATAFVDTNLQPETTYRYSVASVDAEGIRGAPSGEVSATTAAVEDVVPPAPPTGLRLVTP